MAVKITIHDHPEFPLFVLIEDATTIEEAAIELAHSDCCPLLQVGVPVSIVFEIINEQPAQNNDPAT